MTCGVFESLACNLSLTKTDAMDMRVECNHQCRSNCLYNEYKWGTETSVLRGQNKILSFAAMTALTFKQWAHISFIRFFPTFANADIIYPHCFSPHLSWLSVLSKAFGFVGQSALWGTNCGCQIYGGQMAALKALSSHTGCNFLRRYRNLKRIWEERNCS